MYVSISQEILRQHREEVMHSVAAARQAGKTPSTYSDVTLRLMRNVRWELSRYAGLFGKRLRK